MWLDKDGIFRTKILPVVEIDIEDITDNMLVTRTMTGNKPHLKMFDSRTNWKMTSEAQAYFKVEDKPERTIARAILVNSAADKLIKSFLLKLYKPSVPLKFFTSEAEAVTWLLGFKN